MARNLNCPNCGYTVGNCGHVAGGLTSPTTLRGTCPNCNRTYEVSCDGSCVSSS
ncbi:MAG TPA: hypothetical protein VFQ39_20270 [Longimicrobium sp.]|nr:hypothetical protein [Longimicrobium sp.]